jgi:hypothetical protein
MEGARAAAVVEHTSSESMRASLQWLGVLRQSRVEKKKSYSKKTKRRGGRLLAQYGQAAHRPRIGSAVSRDIPPWEPWPWRMQYIVKLCLRSTGVALYLGLDTLASESV